MKCDYAPILITTLCRFEHFKRCIDSLSRNASADKTNIYIALDYPFDDSHWDGYKKILEYLTNEFDSSLFASMKIIKRKRNVGSFCNAIMGREELFEQYDKYIFTEDDNEFSENFIEYTNKCLDKYKEDQKIVAVCGFSPFMEKPNNFENNYFLSYRYDAWGVGIWRDKRIVSTVTGEKIRQFIKKSENLNKLKKYCIPKTFFYSTVIWKVIRDGDISHDQGMFISNIINDTFSIYPTDSKSKNHGLDGSGMGKKSNINYKSKNRNLGKIIDDTDSFEFIGNEITDKDINYYYLNNQRIDIKVVIKYIVIQIYFLIHYRRFI